MGFSVKLLLPLVLLITYFSCDMLYEKEHTFDNTRAVTEEAIKETAVETAEEAKQDMNPGESIENDGSKVASVAVQPEPAIETDVEQNTVDLESYVMEITAYNATVEQCGKADGITASGTYVTEGRTVACNNFPFGTKLLIGGREYVVEDRCGYDNVVDIYFDSYDDAMKWGRKTMEVIVVR